MPELSTDQLHNYGLWLQSGAIFLSFVGVIITASVTRGVARRRATLDLLMSEQSTELLVKLRQDYLALKKAGHLVQYAAPDQQASDQTLILRSILNRYELTAVGINEKTLNQRVYRRYIRTSLVEDWIACKPYVVQRRQTTNNPKLYCEIEKLAKRWCKNGEHC